MSDSETLLFCSLDQSGKYKRILKNRKSLVTQD